MREVGWRAAVWLKSDGGCRCAGCSEGCAGTGDTGKRPGVKSIREQTPLLSPLHITISLKAAGLEAGDVLHTTPHISAAAPVPAFS